MNEHKTWYYMVELEENQIDLLKNFNWFRIWDIPKNKNITSFFYLIIETKDEIKNLLELKDLKIKDIKEMNFSQEEWFSII